MRTRTIGELLTRCWNCALLGIVLGAGGVLSIPIAAAACAETGEATALCTQSQSIGDTVAPTAESMVSAATVPVFNADPSASDQALLAEISREPPARRTEAGGMDILSGAAYGAGALLIVGILGLAGLNSRKRPLRLSKTTPGRD